MDKHEFDDLWDSEIKLEKGYYVITDPCYVFPKEMWGDLCSRIFCRDRASVSSGVIGMDGFKIWWGCTAFGDGSYQVKKSGVAVGSFGVDAGLFAIFPLEFAKKYCKASVSDLLTRPDLAATLEMEGLVIYDDGNMRCGDIIVDTSGDTEAETESRWEDELDEDDAIEEGLDMVSEDEAIDRRIEEDDIDDQIDKKKEDDESKPTK
jgi:hypothetical protein